MEVRVTTREEFEQEAMRFARTLTPNQTGATLVTLSGELGAGKTTFTQAVAKVFGIDVPVTSPTFVLEKIYPLINQSGFTRLIHIDAYRLESGKDLSPLSFHEALQEPTTLMFLEWPERVKDALPSRAISIHITSEEDNTRTITYGNT